MGLFSGRIGAIHGLETVPISQRQRDYAPPTKLLEFLVAILRA